MRSRSECFEELEEPHRRGDAAEGIIIGEFIVRGFTVLTPRHDNHPYDFVIDEGGKFFRFQAKTAYQSKNEGTVRFETRSTRVKSRGYEREGYGNEIDFFAVYNPISDQVYVVPIEEAPENQMAIRCAEPPKGYESRINWHEEYLLDRFEDEIRGSEF